MIVHEWVYRKLNCFLICSALKLRNYKYNLTQIVSQTRGLKEGEIFFVESLERPYNIPGKFLR